MTSAHRVIGWRDGTMILSWPDSEQRFANVRSAPSEGGFKVAYDVETHAVQAHLRTRAPFGI